MLEFWPDYNGALLWTATGQRISLDVVPLPQELIERAQCWIGEYNDSRLPWELTRDDEWLSDGQRLFVDLRRELLTQGFALKPNEDFWAARDRPDHDLPSDIGGR
jgi:hypothetical protein